MGWGAASLAGGWLSAAERLIPYMPSISGQAAKTTGRGSSGGEGWVLWIVRRA